jgi:hypothetical protein
MRKLLWALELDRVTLDRRPYALTAITAIIHTIARLTATTAQIIFWAGCLSAPARGFAVSTAQGTDEAFTAVASTAEALMDADLADAVDLIAADFAAVPAGSVEVVDFAAVPAGSAVVTASMVAVVVSTAAVDHVVVAADSTVAVAAMGADTGKFSNPWIN